MRKVHVEVKVNLYIVAEDNVEIDKVINEMDYRFTSNISGAVIEDPSIADYGWFLID
jgi:hypothetical protein